MIIGALLIGLLTAYYFGVKPGIAAAGVSAALFFIAAVVPGLQLGVYGLVAVFVAGVCVLGPRMAGRAQQDERKNAVRRLGRRVMGEIWRRL